MEWKKRFASLNPWTGRAADAAPKSTRERLEDGFARLQNIRMVRNHLQNPEFQRDIEDRIVFRELIELELQDVDEKIERIVHAAGGEAEKLH